jgi:hypothetical protein
MGVAKTAVTALKEYSPFAGTDEIGEHQPVIRVHDLSPRRDLQDKVLSIGAGPIAARPGFAVLGPEMLPVAVIDQCIEIVRGRKDDVAALAAIAAVGAAELDEFFTAKTGGTASAVAAFQIDLALIEELHRSPIDKGERMRPFPSALARSGTVYSAASAGGGAGGITET